MSIIVKDKFKLIVSGLDRFEALKMLVQEINKIDITGTAVVAFIGGAASGKSSFCQKLKSQLGLADVLSTDDYVVGDRKYRHEHLDQNDPILKYRPEVMNEHIAKIVSLKSSEVFRVPERDEKSGIALDAGEKNFSRKIDRVKYLIVEGDFLFVKNPDFIIYFDVPDEIRKANRIYRDSKKRMITDRAEIAINFDLRQKTQHIKYTEPVKKIADLILKAQVKSGSSGNYIYQYSVYLKRKD